jgi:hypothetical protein
MINEIDQRENKVLDFINLKNQELSLQSQNDKLQNSPELKMRKLNDECQKGKAICIDTILGKLYKDALPFDDPKKNCTDDEARDEIHDYIAKRTGCRGSEYYVKEAIKRNNSSTLKNLLEAVDNICKKFYTEAKANMGSINLKDLNFNMNLDTDGIDKITKKLEFDDIADIIHDNVQKAVQGEVDKAKREDDYNQKIEDSLVNDPSVIDDTSMESAMGKMNVVKQPTIYQPSLFEAIMLGNKTQFQESAMDEVFTETIHEYTKLNMTKALKLEKFDLQSVRNMANSYLA